MAILALVLVLLILQQFTRYIGKAASGEISSVIVFELLGVQIVHYLATLIPGVFFMASVFALGRLHRDQEMVALASAGVSPLRPLRSTLLLMLVLLPLIIWLAFYVSPWAMHYVQSVKDEQASNVDLVGLSVGRFAEFQRGRLVYFVGGQAADDKTYTDVFIQQRRADGLVSLTVAEQGFLRHDDDTGATYLTLTDGGRYTGEPGQGDYELLSFERYQLLLRAPEKQNGKGMPADETPTSKLLVSSSPRDLAELHGRLAVPVSAFVLMILAVAIAGGSKRGRHASVYGRAMLALLVYIIYGNLQSIAKTWLESSVLPPAIGIWWVHILMLAIAAIWIQRRSGL